MIPCTDYEEDWQTQTNGASLITGLSDIQMEIFKVDLNKVW